MANRTFVITKQDSLLSCSLCYITRNHKDTDINSVAKELRRNKPMTPNTSSAYKVVCSEARHSASVTEASVLTEHTTHSVETLKRVTRNSQVFCA